MNVDHSVLSSNNEASEALFVARQPVFDLQMNVWGYELLYRHAADALTAQVTDAAAATSKVIADGITLGRSGLSDAEKTLVNFPSKLLLDGFGFALPAESCIIEILETVESSPEIFEALRTLKAAGYTLALDDFVGNPAHEPLLAFADIIKVDVLATPEHELPGLVKRLLGNGRLLLAEKVEDEAMHAKAMGMGFSLFQGYFYSRPEMLSGRKMSSAQTSKIRLLKELADEDFDMAKVAHIIETDLSLSYRLLRYINSASFGRLQVVESIGQAITFLGQKNLAKWLQAVIMSDLNPTDKGKELVFLSVRRAKFLEMLARSLVKPPGKPDSLFVLGLFSFLDALLGQSMEDILKDLPLQPDLTQALLGQGGEFGEVLGLAEDFEKANWKGAQVALRELQLPPSTASIINADALRFAGELVRDVRVASPVGRPKAPPLRHR